MSDTNRIKQNEAQKLGLNLKRLSNDEIDGLLSTILQEMRRRDSAHVKGDVVASSKALRKLRGAD
jgi:hypothetical protein